MKGIFVASVWFPLPLTVGPIKCSPALTSIMVLQYMFVVRFNSLLGVLVFVRVDVGDDPGPGKAQGPFCQVALDSVHPPPLPFHFPLGPTPLYIHRNLCFAHTFLSYHYTTTLTYSSAIKWILQLLSVSRRHSFLSISTL